MKKAKIVIIAVFALIIVFLGLYLGLTSPYFSGDFSINEYKEEIENLNFKTEKKYERITDFRSAAKVGKAAISERFDHSDGSIFEWMGCRVRYDQECSAYYVRTFHVNPRVLGGAYDVIIQSDGTVLAIWGEK